MKKRRMILHIGTHKTGTTSIQEALEGARAVLKSRGILYPRTDREPWPNLAKHCSVYAAARSDSHAVKQKEREVLQREFAASKCSTMIISEEALSEPHASVVEFFRPFADEFDIDVICYLRRQDYFVESMYNQFVRERARKENRTILGFSRLPATRERLEYDRILRRWSGIARSVTALDFEREVKTVGLIKSFLTAAELKDLDLEDAPANRSPSMSLVLLLARLNRYRVDYDLARVLAASRVVDRSGRFPHVKLILGGDERARLLAELGPSNARLKKEFGVSFSPEMPAGERAFASEEPDLDYCCAVVAAMSEQQA